MNTTPIKNNTDDKKLVDMNALDKYDELIKEFINDKIDNHSCPVASNEQVGLVKPSEEITIEEDGSMTVNKISIDKIVSSDSNDVVILGDMTVSDL